ncbi:hypothetical protein DMA12_01090 [Amycolatopsis balhimycina DSM 5908]|uniref:DUF6318 domain-containing protein n=1 Tax=Amycolatopsis balhimycina DSM 5908 TaxID=1081091 RepID=A0A428X626_AMYBA|nr:DUF6318 family protein [Amycolatopsis balhimycina]RSM50778.1 hypothetical protein DMA12_01090 [Amycolatopsis balhimycina DSM 5908]
MRSSRGGRCAAITFAAGLLATACSTSGAPAAPATTTASVPPMPPPAAKKDAQGATSFATHWLDLVDYGYRSLDAGPLRGLAAPTCEACTQLAAQLDRDKAAGATYQGGRVHFRSAVPGGSPEKPTVTVLFDQDELKVLDRAGATTETVPANRTIFVFELDWSGTAWRTAAIKLGVEKS